MIILSYVKLGTIPFGCARVKGKKNFPKENDIIFIREHTNLKNKYDNPWIEVIVDKVDGDIYFVSKKQENNFLIHTNQGIAPLGEQLGILFRVVSLQGPGQVAHKF